jgi:hypothetical protein
MRGGVSILVGNGFNKLLANMISSDSISNRLNEIAVLYNKFSELFEEIKNEYSLRSEEEAIELFYNALTIVNLVINNSLNPQENWKVCLNEIKQELDREVMDKIYSVIDEFISDETTGFYGNLRKELKKYGFFINRESIKQNKDRLFIFTTNYDGSVDIFFRFNDKDGFIFNDLFNRRACPEYTEEYVCFDNSITPEPPLLFHIHGSYKFFIKQQGFRYVTIKLSDYNSSDYRNLIPVIIYNAPNMKQELIKKFEVLSTYFSFFKKNLQENTEKLIIIGQSLLSDPHILDAISQSYLSLDEIVIMDIDDQLEKVKDRIYKRVIQKFGENNLLDKFRLINTREIRDISEFYDILEKLIVLKETN